MGIRDGRVHLLHHESLRVASIKTISSEMRISLGEDDRVKCSTRCGRGGRWSAWMKKCALLVGQIVENLRPKSAAFVWG